MAGDDGENMREVNGMMVVDELLRDRGIIKADEVWVHGMWTFSKWRRCYQAIRAGKRLVRMTHGSLSPIYLERQSRIKKRLVAPIERWLFRHAERVVVTGEWEARWCRDWGIRNRIEIIDLKKFFTFKSPVMNEGTRHVLYLGRIHPLKGIEYLRRAVEGLEGIELKIEDKAFGDEKEKLWEWCDILVLPSMSENFGLVVAEARARGKRVIVSDGAPAWSDMPKEAGVYLRGFVAASEAEKVMMLRKALRQ